MFFETLRWQSHYASLTYLNKLNRVSAVFSHHPLSSLHYRVGSLFFFLAQSIKDLDTQFIIERLWQTLLFCNGGVIFCRFHFLIFFFINKVCLSHRILLSFVLSDTLGSPSCPKCYFHCLVWRVGFSCPFFVVLLWFIKQYLFHLIKTFYNYVH